MTWHKEIVRADPFPFRVGKVRLSHPGWLNGGCAEHDPREEFDAWKWSEEK